MKNDQLNDNSSSLQDLFADLRKVEISAPVFMKTRVLAQLREARSLRSKLFFWKAISTFAMTALVVVLLVTFNLSRQPSPVVVANQVYVIHIDFNQDDQTRVAQAEVELPEGVQFESKRPEIRGLRKLKLPVTIGGVGRAKLPFVLSSASAGEKEIQVRLLDSDNQLIRKQVMKFKFAQASAGQRL